MYDRQVQRNTTAEQHRFQPTEHSFEHSVLPQYRCKDFESGKRTGNAYVEAFPDETTSSWVKAHVHMFSYFGGVTKILVPDNTTTAGGGAAVNGE